MSKKVVIVVLSILLVIAIIGIVTSFWMPWQKAAPSGYNWPAVNITYGNFVQQMSQQSFVQDLPSDGVILLRFYNFNSGTRTWEKSYILRKGNVQEGTADNADITMSLNSKYLQVLTNQNLCAVTATAKSNGDLGIDTSLSKTALLWKYRSMTQYRSCLGL